GDGGEFQLVAVNAEVGFTAPVPPLAIIVRLVTADLEQGLQVFRQVVPLLHVGEEVANPGAGNVVREEVVGHVGPTDCVVFGDAGPGHAVELARLQGDLDVFPGEVDRNHAELRQEATGGREGEDALAF